MATSWFLLDLIQTLTDYKLLWISFNLKTPQQQQKSPTQLHKLHYLIFFVLYRSYRNLLSPGTHTTYSKDFLKCKMITKYSKETTYSLWQKSYPKWTLAIKPRYEGWMTSKYSYVNRISLLLLDVWWKGMKMKITADFIPII